MLRMRATRDRARRWAVAPPRDIPSAHLAALTIFESPSFSSGRIISSVRSSGFSGVVMATSHPDRPQLRLGRVHEIAKITTLLESRRRRVVANLFAVRADEGHEDRESRRVMLVGQIDVARRMAHAPLRILIGERVPLTRGPADPEVALAMELERAPGQHVLTHVHPWARIAEVHDQ